MTDSPAPDAPALAYLHGFASSSKSRKGVELARRIRERLGLTVETPDLNNPSFAKLTFSGALAAVDAMDAERCEGRDQGRRWGLIGSSMGGYLAARWAELHPDRVAWLVLLCPGFELGERWPEVFGAAAMQRWRETGFLTLPDGAGVPTEVHWELVEDASSHPARPRVPCPTVIIHGRNDETVPIEISRRYVAENPGVRLVELEDDHSLLASVDRIEVELVSCIRGVPARG